MNSLAFPLSLAISQVCSVSGGCVPSLVKIPAVSYSQPTFTATEVGVRVCVCVQDIVNSKSVQGKIPIVSTTVGQHKVIHLLGGYQQNKLKT